MMPTIHMSEDNNVKSVAPVCSRREKLKGMKILMTGATGLVGTALIPMLQGEGHSVVRLVRKRTRNASDILWNPAAGTINIAELENFDAAVHLAGESIASGRWTAARKEKILRSRVDGTHLLSQSLARLQQPPRVLVSASAIGYYGNRGSETLSEASPPGSGFLSEVCRAWEAATDPAAEKGIRVVNIRTGIVLSTRGGALRKMLLPFRLFVGGKIGSGEQYMSWISLADLCRTFLHAARTASLKGPVNAVAPTPVTNAVFTKALGAALHRPTFAPLPAAAARIALGEMADELLLASARVVPARLLASGFFFKDREIVPTLQRIVKEKL
jgi:uncharacterized protein (TIGR01777 family)